MAERYTRLASLPENQYAVGSPILITAGALLKDNQTGKALAQVKFKNISEKQIKAIKISVSAFDVSGKELDGVAEYQYLDLTAARTAEFGHKQAVTLPDAVTRSIEVKCTAVFFADGTVWNAEPNAIWTSLPTQKSVTEQLGDLAAQYQRDTTPKSKFIPIEYEGLWFCSCGEINHNEESKCHNCRHDKTALFAALDIDALRQRDAEYNAAEAEKAEHQAAADAVQRAKTTKFAIIGAAIIAVIASAFLVTTKVIIPNSKYNNAVKLMDAGKYEEAIVAFEVLNEYKDSTELVSECYYLKAVELINVGKHNEAAATLETINAYKDSAELIPECYYQYAITLMTEKEFDTAISVLNGLGEYKDSIQKIGNCYLLLKIEELTNANIGDFVNMGYYEQDNREYNGAEVVQWRVLAKEDSKVLLISKYVLDGKRQNEDGYTYNWKDCSLRKWLNDDFLNATFSALEQELISITTVPSYTGSSFETNPEYNTQDRIFLLSVDEVNGCFRSVQARVCQPTDYAAAHMLPQKNGNCTWWLRPLDCDEPNAVIIDQNGDFEEKLKHSVAVNWGVRPAMWIDLSVE